MVDRRPRGAKSPALTWLVTRARAEGREWVASLRARGLRAALLPCIERRRRPFPREAFDAGAGRPVLFVTSAFAVPALPLRRLAALDVRIAALEPRTAAALRARGVAVDLGAHGGAEALAAALSDAALQGRPPFVPGERLDVVYPTSDAGGVEPEQRRARRALARLGRLSCPVVYETVAPAGLVSAVQALAGRRVGLLFASPSAVRHFLLALAQLAKGRARRTRPRATSKLRGRAGPDACPCVEAVVCLGGSTARAWNAAGPQGWPRARRAEPGDALFDVCARLEARLGRAKPLVPRPEKE